MRPRLLTSILLVSGLACTPPPSEVVLDTDTSSGATEATTGAEATSQTSTTAGTAAEGSGSSDTGVSGSAGTGPGSTGADPAAACEGDEGHIIYVNFDGPTLTSGLLDSAPDDVTQIEQFAGDIEPYDGDDKEEILAAMREHWAPFDVCLTDERPGAGAYAMVVITPTNPFADGVRGLGPLDCENMVEGNIAFTIVGAWATSAEAIAKTSSGSLGPTFGLENHGADNTDLMCRDGGGPSNCFDLEPPRSFKDECFPVFDNVCAAQHALHCAANGQNAFQELLMILGPAT